MSINGWLNKENMENVLNYVLFIHKNKIIIF